MHDDSDDQFDDRDGFVGRLLRSIPGSVLGGALIGFFAGWQGWVDPGPADPVARGLYAAGIGAIGVPVALLVLGTIARLLGLAVKVGCLIVLVGLLALAVTTFFGLRQ